MMLERRALWSSGMELEDDDVIGDSNEVNVLPRLGWPARKGRFT